MYNLAEKLSNSQGFIGFADDKKIDLNKKSLTELRQLLKQNQKLLSNKKIVSKLPDKGAKLTEFCEQITKCIENKRVLEETTSLLSELSINKIVPNQPTLEVKPEDLNYENVMNKERENNLPCDLYAHVLAKSIDKRNETSNGGNGSGPNGSSKFRPNRLSQQKNHENEKSDLFNDNEGDHMEITDGDNRAGKYGEIFRTNESRFAMKPLSLKESLEMPKPKEKLNQQSSQDNRNVIKEINTAMKSFFSQIGCEYEGGILSEVEEEDDGDDNDVDKLD